MDHQNVSSKFLIKKYHHNVCLKCLIQCLIKCLMKLYNQNVSSKRLIKMSYQKISSKCFIKMSHQNVLGNGNFRKNASEPQSRLMKTTVGFLLQDFYKIKNFHKLVNFAVFLSANFCTVKKNCKWHLRHSPLFACLHLYHLYHLNHLDHLYHQYHQSHLYQLPHLYCQSSL